jgi:isoleucyl-tRNA synthetase
VPSSPSRTGSAHRNEPLYALLVCVGLLAPIHPSCAGEVYKSVDAQGHIVYSDRAATPTAQKSAVHVIPGDPAEAERAARQTSLLKAQDSQRKHEEDMDNRSKATTNRLSANRRATATIRSRTRMFSTGWMLREIACSIRTPRLMHARSRLTRQ